MTSLRYAIYYAPQPQSALWCLASAWLGRDAATGQDLEPPDFPGMRAADVRAITRDPARYGFHATLKPPFRLKEGVSEQDLLTAVERFAAVQAPVPMPRLIVSPIGKFLALTPANETAELHAFAADCVATFDPYRAPPDEAELARRRHTRLTPREDELLLRWGYPYVMDAFRFHMTLTGPLGSVERARICQVLADRFDPLTAEPFPIDSVTLFEQRTPETPFRILKRFPFPGCG